MSITDIIASLTCLATWIYMVLVAVTLWYIYQQLKAQKETHKLQSALTIFSELYTEMARKARKKVYKEVPANIDDIDDEKLESYLEIVQDACFMYHRIGYLISKGYIDSDTIITTHWRTVWRCWKKSEKLIEWARTKRDNQNYLEYFKHIFDLSEAYRIESKLEEPKIY